MVVVRVRRRIKMIGCVDRFSQYNVVEFSVTSGERSKRETNVHKGKH